MRVKELKEMLTEKELTLFAKGIKGLCEEDRSLTPCALHRHVLMAILISDESPKAKGAFNRGATSVLRVWENAAKQMSVENEILDSLVKLIEPEIYPKFVDILHETKDLLTLNWEDIFTSDQLKAVEVLGAMSKKSQKTVSHMVNVSVIFDKLSSNSSSFNKLIKIFPDQFSRVMHFNPKEPSMTFDKGVISRKGVTIPVVTTKVYSHFYKSKKRAWMSHLPVLWGDKELKEEYTIDEIVNTIFKIEDNSVVMSQDPRVGLRIAATKAEDVLKHKLATLSLLNGVPYSIEEFESAIIRMSEQNFIIDLDDDEAIRIISLLHHRAEGDESASEILYQIANKYQIPLYKILFSEHDGLNRKPTNQMRFIDGQYNRLQWYQCDTSKQLVEAILNHKKPIDSHKESSPIDNKNITITPEEMMGVLVRGIYATAVDKVLLGNAIHILNSGLSNPTCRDFCRLYDVSPVFPLLELDKDNTIGIFSLSLSGAIAKVKDQILPPVHKEVTTAGKKISDNNFEILLRWSIGQILDSDIKIKNLFKELKEVELSVLVPIFKYILEEKIQGLEIDDNLEEVIVDELQNHLS